MIIESQLQLKLFSAPINIEQFMSFYEIEANIWKPEDVLIWRTYDKKAPNAALKQPYFGFN